MKWRKWIAPGILILLLLVAINHFRFSFMFFLFTPWVEFKKDDVPAAPDYANLKSWAMHPEKSHPTSTSDALRVFWIHPTTYRSPLQWNENPMEAGATDRFQWTLEQQASIFTSCCLVHAPHYRQATLAAYWKTESGFQARALAYSDVRKAFDRFLAEDPVDKPFVLAGHSQGSEHGLRLLQDKISGTPLQKRLVAAYLIGIPIHLESMQRFLPDIPVCSQPDQIGCLISWSTFKETTNPEKFLKQAVWPQESGYHSVSGAFVCVNPVSWLLDGQVPSSIGAQAYELNRDSKSRLGTSRWFSRRMMWEPDLSRAATINSMTFRSFITISRTTSGRGGTRSLTRIKGYRRHG